MKTTIRLCPVRHACIAARLEASAEALANAARLQMQVMMGPLKVSGGGDVAGVMGDVIRGVQADRSQNGQFPQSGIDHLTVADRMARAMGVMPVDDTPPVQENLSRFGLFADHALRLGLSGQQTEEMVREVKSSPDGQLTEPTCTALVEQVHSSGTLSYEAACNEVHHLEHSAQMLPNEITAFGLIAVPQTDVQPLPSQVAMAPDITVAPQVDVTIDMPDNNRDTYNEAIGRAAALDGSSSIMGGES